MVHEPPHMTSTDLEAQVSSLVEHALAGELPLDTIRSVLCDALMFVSEYAHPDHHFYVAVVDLGATDDTLVREPFPDRVETLRRRYVRGEQPQEEVCD
jgi:hypothetical protein